VSKIPEENTKHLDEMTCLLYIERQLERARGLEVSAHTQDCADCRTLLRALERESRLLTRAMLEEDEPLPSRLAQFQERPRKSMQWIWGLVFGLAATGAYALYTEYVIPWQDQLEKAGFGGSNLLGLLIFQGTMWKGWQSVITLLEVLAIVTLGGLGAMFFRRRIRRGSALALVFAGFCSVLAMPSGASATEFRHEKQITIAKDEVIHNDLFAAGGRIRIEGTIEGDLVVAGGEVEVSGHVQGDIISSSGALRVTGQVDGNIRGYAGNFSLKGTVGRNVMVFGGEVIVDREAKIGGSLTAFCGQQSVDGHLGRDLLAFAGEVSITGNIAGGARIKGGELRIDSSAQIDGPVDFEGDKPAEVSPRAKLASPVHYKKLRHGPDYSSGRYYLWRVIWTAALILFGMVLFLLAPKLGTETVSAAERYGAPIGLGVLVFFGIPIAALIACFTVVGIPLAIFVAGFWLLMLFSAELVVGAVVGNLILGRAADTWGAIGRMALGFAIVRIIYTPLAQVHVIGFLVALGIWMWGMGAISLAIYRRFQPVIAQGMPPGQLGQPLPPNTTVGGVQPA
jgi:cytoskeletal protein CcmA (bactofilin family)